VRIDGALLTVALTVTLGLFVEVAMKIEGVAEDSAEQYALVGLGHSGLPLST
jgi:hypothetical protein